MAKDDKKVLLVAQEIKLVKILAGNNKKLRDRTLKRLSSWLNDRNGTVPLTEEALMRIWKGLFYSMWMSDKPLIQEDCAEKIANLIHLSDVKSSLLFFKCFLQTMVNEWYGIDNHRIDKFLMLIRRVLRQSFEVLHKNNWENEQINQFREILNQTALKIDKNTALGLCLHVNDIFLEELAKVSKGLLSGEKVLELIQPFTQQLARVEDRRQAQHIVNHIFKYLINQTDTALEYREKFDAWKRSGFPGRSLDAMESIDSDIPEDHPDLDLDDLPKDPRAGKVDVVLPQLKFNPTDVVNLLDDLRFKKYTSSLGRKTIVKLIKYFKLLADGIYPLGLTKIPIDTTDKITLKSSVKSLQNFEKSLTHDSKKAKTKSLKRKKAQEVLLQQISHTENPPKKQKKSETLNEFIEKSEGHLFTPNKTAPKKQMKQAKLPQVNIENQIPIKSQNHFKRNSGIWTVDEFEVPDSPKKNNEWEKPLENGETEIFIVSKKTKNKLKKIAEKKNKSISELVENYTQKMMNGTPKKARVVKNPFSDLTPKSEKKIKFSSKIEAQEFKEHQKQIINSPVIPYDANKKPVKSLLKPNSYTSPINPFYNINK